MPLAPAAILAAAELGISIASEGIYYYQKSKEAVSNGELDLAEELLTLARGKFTAITSEFDQALEERKSEGEGTPGATKTADPAGTEDKG